MSEDIVKSRVEELEEMVKKLSLRVERLESENIILNDQSKKAEWWVAKLIHDYPPLLGSSRSMVKHAFALEERCSALEEKCSALTQELDLQSLRLNAPSMNMSEEEEKSLNKWINEMLQTQFEAPHISNPPELVQSESTATMGVQGAPQSGPTGRKRKAKEMAESGLGTAAPASSSYSGPITFLPPEHPGRASTKRPARDPARRAGRPKAKVQQPMTPPEEPAPEQQVHEEELLVTEEQHTETISVLFESSSKTFEFRSDDYDYDVFGRGNWV